MSPASWRSSREKSDHRLSRVLSFGGERQREK